MTELSEIVKRLQRAKAEHAEVGNRISAYKTHLGDLHHIMLRLRYHPGSGELTTGVTGNMTDTVNRWPTHDEVKADMRRRHELSEEIDSLQASIEQMTGVTKDLLD